ncbi:MAG: hypothetical protein ACPGZP_06940, partial [Panacagrimonas sp.]
MVDGFSHDEFLIGAREVRAQGRARIIADAAKFAAFKRRIGRSARVDQATGRSGAGLGLAVGPFVNDEGLGFAFDHRLV